LINRIDLLDSAGEPVTKAPFHVDIDLTEPGDFRPASRGARIERVKRRTVVLEDLLDAPGWIDLKG
jgi:hypothetical protein